MTPDKLKEAREELLAGFANRNNSRKIFGLLLGYAANSAGQMIAEKERGERNITQTDMLIIAYLREIKKRENILVAAQHVPELNG